MKCKTHEMGNCNVRQHNTVCATLFLRLVCKPTTRYKTRHACGVKRKLVCKGMHKCIIPISDRHSVWCKMGLKGFVVWWLVLSVLQLPLSYSQGSGQFSTCTREWVHLLCRLCCLVHFYMLLLRGREGVGRGSFKCLDSLVCDCIPRIEGLSRQTLVAFLCVRKRNDQPLQLACTVP